MRIELLMTSSGNMIILYYRYPTTHNCLLSIFWRQTLSTHGLQYHPCYHHWCLTNALPQCFRRVCNFYCNSKCLNPCLNPSEGNPTIDLTFEMGFSSRHVFSLPSTTFFPLPQLSPFSYFPRPSSPSAGFLCAASSAGIRPSPFWTISQRSISDLLIFAPSQLQVSTSILLYLFHTTPSSARSTYHPIMQQKPPTSVAFIPSFAHPLIDTSHIKSSFYKYWSLSLPVMANLYWLGCTLLLDHTNISASYLLNKNSFFIANSFKYKVTFLHLYNSLLRLVSISAYHAAKNVHAHTDDLDLLAFYFDPLINSISLWGEMTGQDWVEAGLQVCWQGYNMLNLIHRKVCVHYMLY